MNNKMVIDTSLSIIDSKKLSKQEEGRQNLGYGECSDGCRVGSGLGQMIEEVGD